MPSKALDVCPFVDRACVRERCHAWVKLTETNQLTGQSREFHACGMTHQTHLLLEIAQALHKQEAQTQQMGVAVQQQAVMVRTLVQQLARQPLESLREVGDEPLQLADH